jgi:hypothetical protein
VVSQIDRQTDRETGRQTDRQPDRQTDRQTDTHTNRHDFLRELSPAHAVQYMYSWCVRQVPACLTAQRLRPLRTEPPAEPQCLSSDCPAQEYRKHRRLNIRPFTDFSDVTGCFTVQHAMRLHHAAASSTTPQPSRAAAMILSWITHAQRGRFPGPRVNEIWW